MNIPAHLNHLRESMTLLEARAHHREAEPSSASGTFADLLSGALKGVNDEHQAAEQTLGRYISGQERNLHTTLIALEKADISMKLLLETRNKLLSAYQEIMRTQI